MILLVNKPAGMTSQSVVSKIKYAAREKYGKLKIGHTGTLDPMCTGLLPVLTHASTRLSDLLPSTKAYRAGLLLGRTTDTEDVTGEVLSESEVSFSPDEVSAAAQSFVGEVFQVPPMYSAVRVNGQRLYSLARQGLEVERKPRRIEIFSLDCRLFPDGGENEYQLKVRCSSGTYIRTLCADIGKKLGCGGCMSFLERTESNGFSLQAALSLPDMISLAEKGELESVALSAENAFAFCPSVTVPFSGLRYYQNGGALSSDRLSSVSGEKAGLLRVYSPEGEFLGLGSFAEKGLFKQVWKAGE